MTRIEKAKNQIQKAQNNSTDIRTLIQNSIKELGKALPSHMNAERLVRIALTTLRLNPELYKCTPESFLGALFQSAQLGLEPNVEGQAYIIPFNNKKKVGEQWVEKKEASFQIGYKGYIELFYRHGNTSTIFMDKVCENDEFDYMYGTETYLKHKPNLSNRGQVIGYYAVAKMSKGDSIFKFMGKYECIEHGKQHSKCFDKKNNSFYKSTPWTTDTDAMCMKTVLIQLMKLLPKSIELQKAVAMDETVKTKIDTDMFNIKDETSYIEIEDVKVSENDKNCQSSVERVKEKLNNKDDAVEYEIPFGE